MKLSILSTAVAAITLTAGIASAAPVNLSTWMSEGDGSWSVQADNNSVIQNANTNPTVFHNNTSSSQGNDLRGEITVRTTADDDFIGFVLGFNSGDLTNPMADYLLIDWKQTTQDWTPFGGVGTAGLALSRVSGTLSAELGPWTHDPLGNVTELARAMNLGSTGWANNQTYEFKIDFNATNVKVFVDGLLEIDQNGTFADGGFGFYNFSQETVEYAGITTEVIEPPVIPLPAAGWLLLAGIGSLVAMGRRKA